MSEEILNQIIDETANKIISYLNESVKTTSWDIKAFKFAFISCTWLSCISGEDKGLFKRFNVYS